jgi:hypothetical protein
MIISRIVILISKTNDGTSYIKYKKFISPVQQ